MKKLTLWYFTFWWVYAVVGTVVSPIIIVAILVGDGSAAADIPYYIVSIASFLVCALMFWVMRRTLKGEGLGVFGSISWLTSGRVVALCVLALFLITWISGIRIGGLLEVVILGIIGFIWCSSGTSDKGQAKA